MDGRLDTLDSNWQHDKFIEAHLNMRVVTVRVSLHRHKLDSYPTDPLRVPKWDPNWNISIQTGDMMWSVEIDMTRGPNDGGDGPRRGKIEIESIDNGLLMPLDCPESVLISAFDVAGGTTLQKIIDYINGKGRQRYAFAEGSEDCTRFWVETIITDLIAAGVITGELRRISPECWELIKHWFKDPAKAEANDFVQGTFY